MVRQHFVYLENVSGILANHPVCMYEGNSFVELKEKFFDNLPFVPPSNDLFDFYNRRYGSSNKILLNDTMTLDHIEDVFVRACAKNS
jgi:hypothetical protein